MKEYSAELTKIYNCKSSVQKQINAIQFVGFLFKNLLTKKERKIPKNHKSMFLLNLTNRKH